MSFIACMRLVADCTAASCSAMESLVLPLCREDGSGGESNDQGMGLRPALLEPW